MSRPWPTLAAACWVARSRGRLASPSGARPAAIAPDETRMISVPVLRLAASASARAVSDSSEMPPLMLVSDDEPTFTTIRRALASTLLSTDRASGSAADALEVIVRVQSTLLERLGNAAAAYGLSPD